MHLQRIIVYPIKSLDGVRVSEARITAGGCLEFDRAYAIFDEAGKVVNAKRTPRIQLLRSTFDPLFQEIEIGENGSPSPRRFVLAEPAALAAWLSEFLGFHVTLAQDLERGFPDDRNAPGPTIISEASLRTITEWFPEITLESARRRFRSNLEIGPAPAFWEDHLFGAAGELTPFRIGDVRFAGHNPCQRCAVPGRDPDDATVTAQFQKTFMELRQTHLPPWAHAERFNHYYRLAVNTSIPGAIGGEVLREGDAVTLE